MVVAIDPSQRNASIEAAMILLSLDRTMRYWTELGIEFSNPRAVQSLVRVFVDRGQRIAWEPAQALDELILSVSRIEGEMHAAVLLRWIERFIKWSSPGAPVHMWRRLLGYVDDTQVSGLRTLGLGPRSINRIVAAATALATAGDEVEREILALESDPYGSPWDKVQYEIYRANCDPDVSPLDWLAEHLRALRFVKIWKDLSFSDNELAKFEKWGKVVGATRLGVSPSLLVIPRDPGEF